MMCYNLNVHFQGQRVKKEQWKCVTKMSHLFLHVYVHNRQNKKQFTMLAYFEIGKVSHIRHVSAQRQLNTLSETPVSKNLQRSKCYCREVCHTRNCNTNVPRLLFISVWHFYWSQLKLPRQSFQISLHWILSELTRSRITKISHQRIT